MTREITIKWTEKTVHSGDVSGEMTVRSNDPTINVLVDAMHAASVAMGFSPGLIFEHAADRLPPEKRDDE